jgi:tetratricopeptide (TPR) repeat protein
MSLLSALTALLLAARPADAGSEWRRVEADHFLVYSDAGLEDADSKTLQMERFHFLLAHTFPGLDEGPDRPPVPLLAFSGREEFAQFVRPEVSRRGGTPGLHASHPSRPLVAVDASRWEEAAEDLYRDYATALLARRPRPPPWMVAGLSEFFATARLEGDQARLGEASAENLELLRKHKWIRMDELLAADAQSPLLRQPARAAMFRAQSWLLVHWCQLDPERQALLAELVTPEGRLRQIDPLSFSPPAAPRSWLQEALAGWLQQGELPTYEVQLPPPAQTPRTEPVRVPPVEVEYRLGQLLTYERLFTQADVIVQHALSLDSESWMAYDGVGLLALAQLRHGEAKRAFTAAVARTPTSAGAYLDHGRTATWGLHSRAAVASARRAYEQALTLDPALLEAYSGLSDLAYRERDWAEAERWAGRGLQIDPRDSRLRAMLGRAQYAAGDLAHARLNTMLALQVCEDRRSCAEASALVRVVLERL